MPYPSSYTAMSLLPDHPVNAAGDIVGHTINFNACEGRINTVVRDICLIFSNMFKTIHPHLADATYLYVSTTLLYLFMI